MAINASKLRDPRFWNRWLASGAILREGRQNEPMHKGTGSNYLRGCQVIRQGFIDPWGTIRILVSGLRDPGLSDLTKPLVLQSGLALWSQKLLRYGKPEFRVFATEGFVEIWRNEREVVEKILFTEFSPAEVGEYYVQEDGHLRYASLKDSAIGKAAEIALNQIAAGEKPNFLDNSDFVQVSRDLGGQTLIELRLRDGGYLETVLVFKKSGEAVPCKVYYPLSYAKWDPQNPLARHSRKDPVVH